ncbi:MAG: tRNA (guanosine(46)-N7)-methyltransferase TrmB [Candidatus Dasytiphilus stammeri]
MMSSGIIKSFVRRARTKNKYQQAIADYWPEMGITYKNQLMVARNFFLNEQQLLLDIGFGMGTSLVTQALTYPRTNFLGIEVYLPGIGSCLKLAHKSGVMNLRIICSDVVDVLERMIPDNSLFRVQLFFPDPWKKRRHYKRRLLQKDFAELVLGKLIPQGIFHIVTDFESYAEQIINIMNNISGYKNLSFNQDYVSRPFTRPFTKFEIRAQRLGYIIRDIMYEKI